MLQTPKWDDIPDVGLVPAGTYQASIVEIELPDEDGQTGWTSTGKAMARVRLDIVEPAAFAGMPVFARFTLGTEDDPGADEEQTWKTSFGARMFNRLLNKAGATARSVDERCAEALEQQVIIVVSERSYTDNEGRSQKSNDVNSIYALGEREPRVDDGSGGPPKAKPGPKAGTPTRPAAAARPGPKPATRPTPPQAAKGPGPNGPRPAGKPAATGRPAPANELKCQICQTMIPRAEFAAHVDSCEAVEQEGA